MADVIQFQCPACGTTLRLPLEMAARQGPCPRCDHQIVAPDPYRGIGAYQPEPPRAVSVENPFRPFADSPPLVPNFQGSESPLPRAIRPEQDRPAPARPAPPVPSYETERPQPQSETSAASLRRMVFVLSMLLTSAISLLAGYVLGTRSNWLVSRTPYQVLIPPRQDPAPSPEPKQVQTVLIKPQIPDPDVRTDPAPSPTAPEKVVETAKASAVAESALKAFLDAPDWTTRSAHVLHPDQVRNAMEAYSHKVPDGPTAYKSVSIQNSYTDKKTGNTLFVFEVVTEQHPTGIPVAVSETPSGWLVDWQAFVEFRDELFKSFATGPSEQTGRFHLIVSAPPAARASNTENEHFSSFLLDPPFPGCQQIAYVEKGTEAHATLSAATAKGMVFTPWLEIKKSDTPDGKSYLKIVNVLASDWLPKDP